VMSCYPVHLSVHPNKEQLACKLNLNQCSPFSFVHQIFVPQDDVIFSDLTVKENITYYVKTHRNWPRKKIKYEVERVVNILGLEAKKHKKQISGGQRKRASIGLDLVCKPAVLYLDEPTSGLDSTTSLELITSLQTIARSYNINIIAVMHQPRVEVWRLFDKVMILNRGSCKYFGKPPSIDQIKNCYQLPADLTASSTSKEKDSTGSGKKKKKNPKEIKEPLLGVPQDEIAQQKDITGSNPADVMIDFIEDPNFDWDKLQSQAPTDDNIISANIQGGSNYEPQKTPPFILQLLTFTRRAFLQLTRQLHIFFLMDCGAVALAALLLGIAFKDSVFVGPVSLEKALQCPYFIRGRCFLPLSDTYVIQGMLTCLALGLTSVATSLRALKDEKPIYWRESSTGTSTIAYFLGKNIASIPILLMQPFTYLAVYYFFTNPVTPPLYMYIILLGIQFASMGLGYIAATVVKPPTAPIVGVVLVFYSIITSGFNPTLNSLKNDYGLVGRIIPGVSFARWAMEAFYLAEVRQYEDIYMIQPGLVFWGYNKDYYWLDILLLIILGVVFRIAACVALRFVGRNKS